MFTCGEVYRPSVGSLLMRTRHNLCTGHARTITILIHIFDFWQVEVWDEGQRVLRGSFFQRLSCRIKEEQSWLLLVACRSKKAKLGLHQHVAALEESWWTCASSSSYRDGSSVRKWAAALISIPGGLLCFTRADSRDNRELAAEKRFYTEPMCIYVYIFYTLNSSLSRTQLLWIIFGSRLSRGRIFFMA